MVYTLSNQEALASGKEKLVFVHPENDRLLIKVWKDWYYTNNVVKKYPFSHRFLRIPRYSGLLNEVVEHVAVREREEDTSFLQTLVGLVDTDMGLGLVVDAVYNNDGSLARTVREIIRNDLFEDEHRQAVDHMLKWLGSSHIIIRDFTLNNVIYDERHKRCVVIDGIGSRPMISLRQFSKTYNRYAMQKKIDKFRRRIVWELERRASSPSGNPGDNGAVSP